MKLQVLFRGIEVLDSNVPADMEISNVRYSSLQIQPGDLFVAIVGYETDGHKYIPNAVERGGGTDPL